MLITGRGQLNWMRKTDGRLKRILMEPVAPGRGSGDLRRVQESRVGESVLLLYVRTSDSLRVNKFSGYYSVRLLGEGAEALQQVQR